MSKSRGIYIGPRVRHLRRDLGLTQARMAEDLEISPSYIALIERNQRPLTADLLLRLAKIYGIDVAGFAVDDSEQYAARLQEVLRDPLFTDLDLPALQNADIATNYPGITEAFLRLHTAYREEQLVLADHKAEGSENSRAVDPVTEVRNFLAVRRNSFPVLDDAAQVLSERVRENGGLMAYLQHAHGVRVRVLPTKLMTGWSRRFEQHRDELSLDESLDTSSRQFQVALQIVYLDLKNEIASCAGNGSFATGNAQRLTERALANYAAAALLMPYSEFAQAVDALHYDVEALGRRFGTSFEQTAHRMTTLQKPGQEKVPFFFIRVDAAGNVSKRLDGAGFPFARHGGSCPLWSVHNTFRTPGEIVTQWLELPDGERFFSIARTISAGGGAFTVPSVERAIALGCSAEDAHHLVYAHDHGPASGPFTPIGLSCSLCQRADCSARAVPPIGRQVMSDVYLRPKAPFGFAEG
jgi:predicted transcriptional regulator/transcriptional regulator with XRE-family HTH domain